MIKRTFADIPIFEFDELESTNKYGVDNINILKNEFSSSSKWLKAIICARQQTGGKGRRGRDWLSEPDSAMLASFVIDPLHFGTMLDTTLLITIVNELIRDLGVSSGLKWPNDICVLGNDNKLEKLAGVLTEIASEYLVIGIGINIKKFSDTNIENIAALNDYDIDISQSDLIDKIIYIISEQETVNFESEFILSKYKSMSLSISKRVRVETINETFEGIAVSIAQSGALLLELDDKRIIELSEGDVVHLR
jgi:BirA family biotin operon repressor/biotin-[acetyl-CoA-carboxylase] ligase